MDMRRLGLLHREVKRTAREEAIFAEDSHCVDEQDSNVQKAAEEQHLGREYANREVDCG